MKGKLKQILVETAQARRFIIELEEPLAHSPGQFVMITLPGVSTVKRAFSIVSIKGKELILIIKKNGEFTSNLFRQAPGTSVEVTGPYGRMTLGSAEKKHVFIAGGIGITPLYSIIQGVLKSKEQHQLKLYYSAKTINDMPLLHEIREISDQRFEAMFATTQEKERKGFKNGRITAQDVLEKTKDTRYYLCGSPGMVNHFRTSLVEAGVANEKISSEAF